MVGRPPFEQTTAFMVAAAAGPNLVVMNRIALRDDLEGQPLLAARGPDGRWAVVPDPPNHYENVALASVASSMVLVGAICTNDECSEQEYEFAQLSDDLEAWKVLDTRPKASSPEPSLTAAGGVHDVGVALTDAGTFSITDSGDVRRLPDLSDGVPGGGCVVGSTLIAMDAPVSNSSSMPGPGEVAAELVGVQTLDLGDPDPRWKRGATPPVGVEAAKGSSCIVDGQVYVSETIETTYDATTDTWSQRDAGEANAVLNGRWLSSALGDSVVAADGSLYVVAVDMEGAIAKRSRDGDWPDTGARGLQSLYATSEQVIGFPPGIVAATVVD